MIIEEFPGEELINKLNSTKIIIGDYKGVPYKISRQSKFISSCEQIN